MFTAFVLVFLKFAYSLFLVFANAPGRRAAEGKIEKCSQVFDGNGRPLIAILFTAQLVRSD